MMAEKPRSAPEHNGTAINGSTNIIFNKEVRLDLSYIFTLPGLLKSIVIVLNILIIICIFSSPFRGNGRGVYFLIITIYGVGFSGTLLTLYLYHIVEKYHNIKWLKIEMICYLVLTILYLLASTIAVAFGAASYSAAGFFGYLAMLCYGGDAFLKARALNAGELAQGQHVVSKQTPIAPDP